PSGATDARRRRVTRLASRSGALPAPALAALRLGLERTAVAGGYKVPVAQLAAAPHAIELGRSVPIAADDPHRHSASLGERASGEFRAGPGAPMPAPILQLALGAPFEPPELVLAPPAPNPATRPLGPGEDEIVIPMPLWTQMGRGQASFTDQVMASPVARTSY